MQLRLALLLLPLLLAACKPSSGGNAGSLLLSNVCFETRDEIETGLKSPAAHACADFTGNGMTDIAVVALVEQEVRVLVASSPGVLSEKGGFRKQFEAAPSGVLAADLDGDGDPDLVIAFAHAGCLRAFYNDGIGRFTETGPGLITGAVADFVAEDFDGDGLVDCAVASRARHMVLVFRSLGALGFAKPVEAPCSKDSDLTGLWAGDLNGDKRPDLAATDGANDQVVVWYQTPTGFAQAPRQLLAAGGKEPLSLIGADVTGDGVLDLAVANYASRSLAVFAGDGVGNFELPSIVALDGSPFHLTIGDVYGDGRQHFVVSYVNHAAVGVVENPPGPGFGPERQYPTSGLTTMSAVHDVDHDERMDIVSSGLNTGVLSLLRGTVAGGLAGSEDFATGRSTPGYAVVGDFDKDGRADAIVSDGVAGVCTIMRSVGGVLSRNGEIDVGIEPGAMSAGDLNQDGFVDVVVAVKGGVRFLMNLAAASPRTEFNLVPARIAAPFGGGVGPFSTALDDLDGDGRVDLVVLDQGGDLARVFYGAAGGVPFRAPGLEIQLPGRPTGITAGDFDGDGQRDLAVTRFDGANVTILAGQGRTFSRIGDVVVGRQPIYVTAMDLDHDGRDELMVSNLGESWLSVVRRTGQGWDSENLTVGLGPTALRVGDFNRDGHQDLVVASACSADLHVVLGDGSGGFGSVFRFAGTYDVVSAGLGDVDGDGLDDLVLTNQYSNRITLCLNRSRP